MPELRAFVRIDGIDPHARTARDVEQRGGDVSLDVQSDFSNFSNSQESKTTSQPLARAPIIRQITINGSTLTPLAETVVIGTVDDPNSNREFQLEATVTKLR